MEHLSIKNFLILNNVEMDIRKINLLIGPQAIGKSVIAKLVYFFREFLSSTYLGSVKNFALKKDVVKNGLKTFEMYFPKYTWVNKDFSISYQVSDFEVTISKSRSSKEPSLIKLDYSPSLVSLHRKLKYSCKKKLSLYENELQNKLHEVYWEVIEDCVYSKNTGNSFYYSLFIPASRSFFANLQKNVFSFLASNIDIDPFIKDFGSRYESAKRYYDNKLIKKNGTSEIGKMIENFMQGVLVGKYKYEEEKDWIVNKKSKVNLSNASSGQQEALPMLLILSVFSYLYNRIDRNHTFFIEEPEAHLFPVSQKHIVSIFALIYRKLNHGFFITTHSPYILTAINNLILANDIALHKGEEAISDIVDPMQCIRFEDVAAYTLENGELRSIMNEDERIIGSSIIDSVSDEFDHVFDSLLKIQMDN